MPRNAVILLADAVPDEDCRQQLPGIRQAETPFGWQSWGAPPVLAVSPIKCVPALLPSHGQCREPFGALDFPDAQTFFLTITWTAAFGLLCYPAHLMMFRKNRNCRHLHCDTLFTLFAAHRSFYNKKHARPTTCIIFLLLFCHVTFLFLFVFSLFLFTLRLTLTTALATAFVSWFPFRVCVLSVPCVQAPTAQSSFGASNNFGVAISVVFTLHAFTGVSAVPQPRPPTPAHVHCGTLRSPTQSSPSSLALN